MDFVRTRFHAVESAGTGKTLITALLMGPSYPLQRSDVRQIRRTPAAVESCAWLTPRQFHLQGLIP
jgi:hypothetical protein